MNSHWPALYLKLGLTIRNSIAPTHKMNTQISYGSKHNTYRRDVQGPLSGVWLDAHVSRDKYARQYIEYRARL